ncbi:hypothetical protein [Legionella worsleiensis]|uniref:hypothetical protein n=1 Tax=Legionella worsleiensis TaxID=45076 RepID=UPI003CC8251D
MSQACAIPALTRSRKISCSNSAKIASKPAITLPVAEVKSKPNELTEDGLEVTENMRNVYTLSWSAYK